MGIFDWFKKSDGNTVDFEGIEPPDMHLAMVLLSEPTMPNIGDVVSAFQGIDGGGTQVSECKDDENNSEEDSDTNGNVLLLQLEGIGQAFLALMPAPIPNGEAEEVFPLSISSFSVDELKPHHAHIAVTIMKPEVAPREAVMAFTSLIAAVVKNTPSVGVYWGDAGATHAADFFLSVASDTDTTGRTMLWNGISRAQEPDGRLSVLSHGMNQLGLPDLYLISAQSPGDTLTRVLDLLQYVVSRGEAIPAGETIGATATERLPVKYVRSPADRETPVWRVEI